MQTPAIQSFAHGIHAIDTGFVRPGLAASYLVLRGGRAAFIDTGTRQSVPSLLAALAELGVAREAVDFVILTHVHLDHTGGAGALMQALPDAIAVAHPRGVPHLVDPARLESATRAVYGDRAYDELFGSLVPIPPERVRAGADGEVVLLGGSPLRVVETPGHALHHLALHDETADAVFAGDAFGISYRAFDSPQGEAFIFATSSPTQFDPVQSHVSIERIRNLAPRVVYVAHFGPLTEVERLTGELHRDLDRFVAIAEDSGHGADAEERMYRAMMEHLSGRLAAYSARVDRETAESWLAMDARLNVAGLLAWHNRVGRRRQQDS
jgi:glyoxylase-like metal-dependent hydrolase (beta-lactamase superfamily II)